MKPIILFFCLHLLVLPCCSGKVENQPDIEEFQSGESINSIKHKASDAVETSRKYHSEIDDAVSE